MIIRALDRVDRPGFDTAQVDADEVLLTDFARSYPVADLRRLAARTVDAIDPDGSVPDEQLAQDRRHLTLRRCPDGTYAGECRLTGRVGAKLTACSARYRGPVSTRWMTRGALGAEGVGR